MEINYKFNDNIENIKLLFFDETNNTWLEELVLNYYYVANKVKSIEYVDAVDGTINNLIQKIEYQYNGNQVASMEFYEWNEGMNQWETDYATKYDYKYTGKFLTEESDDRSTTTHIYESGIGNVTTVSNFISKNIFPEPTIEKKHMPTFNANHRIGHP